MDNHSEDLVSKHVREYLEGVLMNIGLTHIELNITPGSIRGDNYLGVIAKVAVDAIDKHGKKTQVDLIVKSAPRQEAFRSLAPIRNAYEREIHFYTKVYPEFAKFQEEKNIKNPFNAVAVCYGTTFEDFNEAIIMEDMKELGFKLQDRQKPLDYNHVSYVLKEYGRYHALSFALKDQNPEVFKELTKPLNKHFFQYFSKETIGKQNTLQSERAMSSLDPVEDKITRQKFQKYIDENYEILNEILGSESVGDYGVITHCDCWINNMLFKYEDASNPSKPTKHCFLDWQLLSHGSPALDLSYFIFTSTDKPLRDKYYKQLINEYYESLSSFLRELGSDPAVLFPREVLHQHLKKYSAYGLYMATAIIYIINSESSEIPDIHNITDMDDAFEKFNFESKNFNISHKRMRGVLQDFANYGYI